MRERRSNLRGVVHPSSGAVHLDFLEASVGAFGSGNGGGVDVETMFSLSRVLKFTAIIVVLQAIVLTCLSTLAAFLYNASSGLVGGVEITLTESE